MSILEIEGAKDVAVEFFSFSKPFAMTGWRLGWFCGNEFAVQMIGKLKSTFDTGVFKAIQKAGAEVLNSKEGYEYCKKANEKFKNKQEILLNGFKELGWDIDNLEVQIHGEHQKVHSTKYFPTFQYCDVCGQLFIYSAEQMRRSQEERHFHDLQGPVRSPRRFAVGRGVHDRLLLARHGCGPAETQMA